MKKSWTQGLTKDIADEVRGTFASSLIIRKRLRLLIEDKIHAAHTASLSKEGYDISNWALKQADQIGYERALNEILSLLEE